MKSKTRKVPKLVPKVEIVYVWDCGIDEHRHQTETAAKNCIDKSPESIAQRNQEIYEMSQRTWKTVVAKKYDLSVSRVTQIIKKIEADNERLQDTP